MLEYRGCGKRVVELLTGAVEMVELGRQRLRRVETVRKKTIYFSVVLLLAVCRSRGLACGKRSASWKNKTAMATAAVGAEHGAGAVDRCSCY